jgi:hypothetical protein
MGAKGQKGAKWSSSNGRVKEDPTAISCASYRGENMRSFFHLKNKSQPFRIAEPAD